MYFRYSFITYKERFRKSTVACDLQLLDCASVMLKLMNKADTPACNLVRTHNSCLPFIRVKNTLQSLFSNRIGSHGSWAASINHLALMMPCGKLESYWKLILFFTVLWFITNSLVLLILLRLLSPRLVNIPHSFIRKADNRVDVTLFHVSTLPGKIALATLCIRAAVSHGFLSVM